MFLHKLHIDIYMNCDLKRGFGDLPPIMMLICTNLARTVPKGHIYHVVLKANNREDRYYEFLEVERRPEVELKHSV